MCSVQYNKTQSTTIAKAMDVLMQFISWCYCRSRVMPCKWTAIGAYIMIIWNSLTHICISHSLSLNLSLSTCVAFIVDTPNLRYNIWFALIECISWCDENRTMVQEHILWLYRYTFQSEKILSSAKKEYSKLSESLALMSISRNLMRSMYLRFMYVIPFFCYSSDDSVTRAAFGFCGF